MNTQFPLSKNQFDIYIDQMKWRDGSHFNIGAIITILGQFDIDCFNIALNKHWLNHPGLRSEEHTSELQSQFRISYAVFCLKKKKKRKTIFR